MNDLSRTKLRIPMMDATGAPVIWDPDDSDRSRIIEVALEMKQRNRTTWKLRMHNGKIYMFNEASANAVVTYMDCWNRMNHTQVIGETTDDKVHGVDNQVHGKEGVSKDMRSQQVGEQDRHGDRSSGDMQKL